MKKNLIYLTVCAMLLAFGLPVQAQQPGKLPRIGFVSGLSASDPGPNLEAFRQGLRDVGYVEGKSILIEYRYAEGTLNRVPGIVDELVQSKVDVVVTAFLPAIHAAKQATTTIPIVMVTTVDPVATGIVDSLARPGGNITGLATLSRDLSGKRLELLQEAVPRMSRVAVLWTPENPGAAISFKEYEGLAPALKIPLQSLEVRGSNPDFAAAFQTAVKGHASALIVIRSVLLNRFPERIADLAIKHRLPSMYEDGRYIETGGLMTYGANVLDLWRRAAVSVDKILKGAKPAELPVEQPTKFEFIINLKTAKQIGLAIPPNVLARADKVIK